MVVVVTVDEQDRAGRLGQPLAKGNGVVLVPEHTAFACDDQVVVFGQLLLVLMMPDAKGATVLAAVGVTVMKMAMKSPGWKMGCHLLIPGSRGRKRAPDQAGRGRPNCD